MNIVSDGLPEDKSYLECGLPDFLKKSIKQMEIAWEKKAKGVYSKWDMDFCELQSDINVAEVEQLISSDQAWYLREKYLGLSKELNT